jgi:glycosyltransferase involved in cell wall biosynthesis
MKFELREEQRPYRVLVSAFACGPNWGSEVGMGWNWVIHMAAHHQLWVITEEAFRPDIEAKLDQLQLRYPPRFHYISIGEKGRKLFWEQGSLQFYGHYRRWQKKALALAEQLCLKNSIELVHQLNLIGFREPGYLWQLSDRVPVIWGPVGGYSQVPMQFIPKLSWKNRIFYFGKNLLHYAQVHYSARVKKAISHCSLILAESSNTRRIMKEVYGVEAVLMNETGGHYEEFFAHPSFLENGRMNLLWVGRIQGLKALPIAIECVSRLKQMRVPVHLNVVGEGPDTEECRNQVQRLGLEHEITFMGKIPNPQVIELMKVHDLLFFTSLKEGTPHVVLEALSNGLPVICHDACGHGDIVDSTCGIKVPLESYEKSVSGFTERIADLFRNKHRFDEFTEGARECVKKHSWHHKAELMSDLYSKVLKVEETTLA